MLLLSTLLRAQRRTAAMTRSMTMSVGALVLSQLLAFTAMATPKCYSTGPLEEENSGIATFFVKVLNNDKDENVQAKIVAFDLDGRKRILREFTGALAPLSSDFLVLEVGGTDEYEVQVKLDGEAADNSLLGGFAKNEDNKLVAAHRLVHSEWTVIDCKDFGLATDTDR
jgi:hypothetical protein